MKRIILTGLWALISIDNASGLSFVAYGDARTYPNDHQVVVDAIARVNPELILFSGDLWDGYGSTLAASSERFRAILNKNANVAQLLQKNLFLVARGNHETESEMLAFQPSLVRNGKVQYSFTQGNCFFISLGMDAMVSLAFLEQQLQSAAAKQATWKFVYSHFPVYSTGDHGSLGMPAFERICDKYGVNVVFNGHDHLYERSHQIYGGKAVDNSNRLTADKGTVYIVSGGGGAPLYSCHTKGWFTNVCRSTRNFCQVKTDENQISVRAMLTNGQAFDSITISRSFATHAAPSASPFFGWLNVNQMLSQNRAILSFSPIRGYVGILEILAADGTSLRKETLASGQTSLAWDYGKTAKGEYLAVLRDGAVSFSRKIPLSN